MVMPGLWQLAQFGSNHHYYVDGSPRIFDICISTPCAGQDDWRTVLIAGLNSGGSGFYALDITNPLAPKAMWEFSNKDYSGTTVANAPCYTDVQIAVQDKTMDCNVGMSYGYPIATKRTSDGKWVVLVTSGYNNAATGGDGRGYLYILDVVTGKILNRITTGSGSAASPSGLARIAAWADDASTNNLALAAYGGDLDGNVWRFQLDSSQPGYLTATKIGQAKDSLGNPQPITVMPELTTINFKRVIMFGTGKFLEQTDRTPPYTTQTIYALADDLTVTGAGPVIPDVRNPADVVVRTLTPGPAADQRTVVAVTSPTDWSTQHGWLIDLPDSGERVNIDPLIQLGFLSIPSNVPTSDTCTAGGYSWFNFFDLATGGYVPAPGNTMASQKIPDALLVGQSVVCGPGGNCEIIGVDNTGKTREEPPPIPPAGFTGRRVSWREMIVDQ
jgi:type IV pilus assembly protein PilY1